MRDFHNFELGDNVYKLSNELIPEIAERLDIAMDGEPNIEELSMLITKLGPNKALRDNTEVTAFEREEMANLVERSGIQKKLSRSLWTPNSKVEVDATVLTGGVANWQNRSAIVAIESAKNATVYYAVGNRVMDTATEIDNPWIMRYHQEFGRYPSEAEYAAHTIVPNLLSRGLNVNDFAYDTANGDDIAKLFFENHPELLEKRIGFARVANAGIQLAVQMRKNARLIDPKFDADPNNPQAFVFTDSFPVSRTAEQDAKPQEFQKAQTALRQLAVTAKAIYEAQLS